MTGYFSDSDSPQRILNQNHHQSERKMSRFMTSEQYPHFSFFITVQTNALKKKINKGFNQRSRNLQFIPTVSEPTLLSFVIKMQDFTLHKITVYYNNRILDSKIGFD